MSLSCNGRVLRIVRCGGGAVALRCPRTHYKLQQRRSHSTVAGIPRGACATQGQPGREGIRGGWYRGHGSVLASACGWEGRARRRRRGLAGVRHGRSEGSTRGGRCGPHGARRRRTHREVPRSRSCCIQACRGSEVRCSVGDCVAPVSPRSLSLSVPAGHARISGVCCCSRLRWDAGCYTAQVRHTRACRRLGPPSCSCTTRTTPSLTIGRSPPSSGESSWTHT